MKLLTDKEMWAKHKDYPATDGVFYFYCPGCDVLHRVNTITENEHKAIWSFNGDMDKPTFAPSVLYERSPRCHTFIKDGNIQYLEDCEHILKGQTIPLPEIPELYTTK